MIRDTITIKRKRMRGDVLLCTPILKRVREFNPHAIIYFETDHPEILRGNPHMNQAGPLMPKIEPMVYELGLNFEKMSGWHIIDALAVGAGFKPGEVKRTLEMFPEKADEYWARMKVNSNNYVVLAPGPGLWEGRNWKETNWQVIAKKLLERGLQVCLVGTQERAYRLPCTFDMRGRTDFHQLAAIIKRAKLFVGIDSFPIHVAGAMGTPRIGLFGVTRPDLILCDSPHTYGLQSDATHEMTGARHHIKTMMQIEQRVRHKNPMDTISIGAVIDKITEVLCKINPPPTSSAPDTAPATATT